MLLLSGVTANGATMGNDPATDNDVFDVAPNYLCNYERNIRQHRIVTGHGRRSIYRKISKSVKSPYELALYFLSISLGICASASLKICAILGIATIGLILVAHIINLVIKRTLNVNIFSTSFAEANNLNIVEVISTGKNESLSIRKRFDKLLKA